MPFSGVDMGEEYRGYRIREIWAWVAIDKQYDDEGIIGTMTRSGYIPLIAADKARLDSLDAVVQEICNLQGQPIQLIKFTNREFIRELTPQQEAKSDDGTRSNEPDRPDNQPGGDVQGGSGGVS